MQVSVACISWADLRKRKVACLPLTMGWRDRREPSGLQAECPAHRRVQTLPDLMMLHIVMKVCSVLVLGLSVKFTGLAGTPHIITTLVIGTSFLS